MSQRALLLLTVALSLGLVSPAPSTAAPSAVSPVVESVSLAVVGSTSDSRLVDPLVREVRGKRFTMVAVRWTGAIPGAVEVQAQHRDGGWTGWNQIEEQDGPDSGTVKGSEPVWVGESTAVRVRAADPTKLSVVLIDPGTSPADTKPLASTTGVGQPRVISRAGWGADERIRTDCYSRERVGVEYASTVKAATIHHTVGTNDYSAADSARIVRGIYAYHAIDNKWCDIGYNVLVDKYGQIFEGRFGGLSARCGARMPAVSTSTPSGCRCSVRIPASRPPRR